jgi:uncharacterized membrane protein
MEYLNLVLRWLHVLSAITLMGGVLYTRFSVVPMLESMGEDQRETVGAALRKNWAKYLMISLALLLVTGITNMALIPMYNEFDEGGPSYGMLAGIKFMLALPVFYIVSLLNGRSDNAAKFRQKSRLWLNIALALCVAIVMLGGFLRFIPRQPKSDESIEPAAARFISPVQADWATNFSGPTSSQKA